MRKTVWHKFSRRGCRKKHNERAEKKSPFVGNGCHGRQLRASRTGTDLWPGWTALQLIALAALVVVLVRRMIRVRNAMRENSKLPNHPQFPFMPGPMNGNGAPDNGTSHNGHNSASQKRKRK
jgi:hypothetical protein